MRLLWPLRLAFKRLATNSRGRYGRRTRGNVERLGVERASFVATDIRPFIAQLDKDAAKFAFVYHDPRAKAEAEAWDRGMRAGQSWHSFVEPCLSQTNENPYLTNEQRRANTERVRIHNNKGQR